MTNGEQRKAFERDALAHGLDWERLKHDVVLSMQCLETFWANANGLVNDAAVADRVPSMNSHEPKSDARDEIARVERTNEMTTTTTEKNKGSLLANVMPNGEQREAFERDALAHGFDWERLKHDVAVRIECLEAFWRNANGLVGDAAVADRLRVDLVLPAVGMLGAFCHLVQIEPTQKGDDDGNKETAQTD